MTAAHTLYALPKEVYRVGNVGGEFTIDHIRDYLDFIGVRVQSCYDRTPLNARIKNNRTFRVCILSIDRDKFLRESNWASGITIQRWEFRPDKARIEGGGPHPNPPPEIVAVAANDIISAEATSPQFENCMEEEGGAGTADTAVQEEGAAAQDEGAEGGAAGGRHASNGS